jgi:hypothetical protein
MYGVGMYMSICGATPPDLMCPKARTCLEDIDRKGLARRRDLDSILCRAGGRL